VHAELVVAGVDAVQDLRGVLVYFFGELEDSQGVVAAVRNLLFVELHVELRDLEVDVQVVGVAHALFEVDEGLVVELHLEEGVAQPHDVEVVVRVVLDERPEDPVRLSGLLGLHVGDAQVVQTVQVLLEGQASIR